MILIIYKNNINDIDNINDMFVDKKCCKYVYNDKFYIILIFGGVEK